MSVEPTPGMDADVLDDVRVRRPRPYRVYLLNDDYTTMEFVVEILQEIFGRNETEAMPIMLKVHREGRGVAGVYPFEIAETKKAATETRARERGFPLKCELEEEDA